MNRLLMLSYPFPPNASAGAVRSERFARYLPQFGWDVDVVTIQPRKDMFEDTERLKIFGEHVRVHFTKTLDPWLWLRDKRPRNAACRALRSVLMRVSSFPDHMLLWVPFAVREGLRICRKRGIDAIYSSSPPHSTHLAGQILSGLTKKPWVADFRDPWTLNAYRDKGIIDQGLLKMERLLEKRVLIKASVILANTRANLNNMLAAFPFLEERKCHLLPNGWEEFPPEYYEKAKRNGPLTIVHAGTFYPRFKPYALFHALAAWRTGQTPPDVPPLGAEDIEVILLGARDDETKRIVHELRLEDMVEIRPWVPLEEARKFMCHADLLWASLGTGKESATYIPSKLYEYIAAKRPILGFFPPGEAESIIREMNLGVSLLEDDPMPVIRFLCHAIQEHRNAGLNYSPDFERVKRYRFSTIASRFSLVLDSLSQGDAE